MASAYPVTLDTITTVNVDNPDASNAINALESAEQPKWLVQNVAYAATVTPDPRLGEVIVIGALTGAITIANPPAGAATAGRTMTLEITQDGTGSRVVTWGAAYKLVATPVATTASKINTVTLRYDTVNSLWVQTGSCTGM